MRTNRIHARRWAALGATLLALAAGCRDDDSDAVPAATAAAVLLAQANPVEFHATASSQSVDACKNCHGDMLSQTGGNATKPAFHPRHVGAITKWDCTRCHVSVDLREGSGGNTRKQVAVSICVDCHKPGGVGAAAGYQLYQN